jgi:nitroreductase
MATPYETLLDIIDRRRSIRAFDSRPVEPEDLERILEAARLAPSSNNTQPWRFVVVRDPQTRRDLALAQPLGTPSPIKFAAEAPVIIACCTKPHALLHKAVRVFGKDFCEIDAAIAVEHMVLAATALDIGTCWLGWFSEPKVKKILKIPGNVKVVALLPLGYPQESPKKDFRQRPRPEGMGKLGGTPRKELKDIVSWERWEF